jgi:AraC-like DNA-binding protein
VLRFRSFLGRLDAADSDADLAGLAADCGFADQAHLTRECSRLAGVSPAALAYEREISSTTFPVAPRDSIS